ncbi:MAG TPA: hypothetical protein VFA34_05535 [Actinomycetota bacterium]|jgi:hypothetical protein|nr:hypothetical protein [Actinomycetota bacterium]
MKGRAAVIALVLVTFALGRAAPAHAQGVFYELDLGRAGVGFWEDHAAEKFSFAVAGQGVIWVSDLGEPKVGDVGCAAVGDARKVTFGCGELSSFSIADDLSMVAGEGVFDAVTIEFESGEKTEGGTVSLKAEWTATSDPAPHSGGGFDVFSDFVGMGMGAELMREADIKGGPAGRPNKNVFAATLVGPSITFEVHGQ